MPMPRLLAPRAAAAGSLFVPLLAALLMLGGATACRSQDRAGAETAAGDTARVDTAAVDRAAGPPPMTVAEMTDGGTVQMAPVRQRILTRDDSLWAEALRIHYNAITIDGHVDTPTLMLDDGYAFGERHPAHAAHLDLPRMAEGGLDAAFFSIYVAPHYGEGERATQRARDLVAEVKRQLALHPDSAALATTAAAVRRLARSGRKAVLLGLEGGHALAGSPAVLRALYDEGVRYVTLTHINTNSWADASQAPPRWGGLNDLGRRLVREMNRLGMIVDLSHVSDSTFYDALRTARAPVLLSHSSARALVDNVRNVDDAMLRALAENDGVILINFFDAMVNPHLTPDVFEEAYRRLGGQPGDLHSLWNVVYDIKRERGLPGASLEDVVDHIDHAVQVAGIDHVGLGSDFDGVFDLPAGLQDVTRLPWITHALLQRGYTEEEIYKLLGGNVLRLMEAVERVAEQPG